MAWQIGLEENIGFQTSSDIGYNFNSTWKDMQLLGRGLEANYMTFAALEMQASLLIGVSQAWPT
jgi:hypothetical protein